MTTNTPIDDSPHELNNGAWVPRGAIVVWEQWGPPEQAPTVMCRICNATATDPCRTSSGTARSDHVGRLAPRCCPCGGPVGPWQKWCADCRPIVSRRTWRESQRRRRAA